MSLVLIWWEVKPGGNYWRGTYELFIDVYAAVLLAFCVANQDYFTEKFLNKKIFSTLGEFSLYFFICHMPVISLVSNYIKVASVTDYYKALVVTLICSTIGGVIMQFLAKKCIMPLMQKLDANVTKAIEEGKTEAK